MKKSPPLGMDYEVGMSEGGLMSMLMSIMQQPDEEVKDEEEEEEEEGSDHEESDSEENEMDVMD